MSSSVGALPGTSNLIAMGGSSDGMGYKFGEAEEAGPIFGEGDHGLRCRAMMIWSEEIRRLPREAKAGA